MRTEIGWEDLARSVVQKSEDIKIRDMKEFLVAITIVKEIAMWRKSKNN